MNFDFDVIVEAVPYITFLYMFQPNVPQTYRELQHSQDGDNPNQTFATHGSKISSSAEKLNEEKNDN